MRHLFEFRLLSFRVFFLKLCIHAHMCDQQELTTPVHNRERTSGQNGEFTLAELD